MPNPNRNLDAARAAPGVGQVIVTPADTDLAFDIRSLYCGGAGTVVLTAIDGSVATWTVTAGTLIPLEIRRVAAASTATLLIGIY